MTAYTYHPNADPNDWQVTLLAADYWVLLLMKTP